MKKAITLIIIGLAVVIGITAYLNASKVKDKETMVENMTIALKESGGEELIVDLNFIRELGEETFSANLKSNGKEPVENQYTGVPLKKILASKNLEMSEKKQVLIKSIDGYTVVLTLDEVMEDDNVYLVYKMNGKMMKSKSEGGSGPYQIVIRKDAFSQRWSKFVVEVELQ